MRSCLPSPNKYRSKSVSPESFKWTAPSHHGLHCPYAVRIFANTAVAREIAHIEAIDDGLVTPFVFPDEQGIHLILGVGVRREIRQHQERLALAQQAVDHRLGVVRTPGREKSRLDESQRAFEVGIGIELEPRLIAGRAPGRDLLRREAENEHIFRSHMVTDLDIGPVQCADGERPFSASFMLPVPEASMPAVEICCDRSSAGMIFCANETS